MQWFLKRISAKSFPVNFGIRDRREHPEDFSKLVKKQVLKRVDNLDSVPCDLCNEDHECQVRERDEKLFYVCENGGGKKTLSDEDLALYEYDNDTFLKLIAEEFGIKTDGSFSDEAAYSENSFYRVGVWKNKTVMADVYYLRTGEAYEPSSLFEHLGNGTKVLITNTTKPPMLHGKEGTLFCILTDTLAEPLSKQVFDIEKFKKCLIGVRRVRFDKKQAQLFLDEKLVYTAGLNSPEHYFLAYLWKQWGEQVSYYDIHSFVREEMGKGVADRPQIFCPKIKSSIKKKCSADIDKIITIPTQGHYMMTDPSR